MSKVFAFQKAFDEVSQAREFINYLSRQAIEGDFSLSLKGKLLEVKLESRFKNLVEDYFKPPQLPKSVSMFCDGGARGNPGPGACGFVLLDEKEKVLLEGGSFFAHCTNNYAEYQGLNLGVAAAVRVGVNELSIFMDSQLIVRQINGQYKVRNQELLVIYKEVKASLAKLKAYQISYIPRRHNTLADSLVNKILDQNT